MRQEHRRNILVHKSGVLAQLEPQQRRADANFVAPLGIPVLDGLGAIGGGAHTLQEFVKVDSLIERTALLASLITAW